MKKQTLNTDRLDCFLPLGIEGMEKLAEMALYDLLEKQVIPEFYDRDQNGTPVRWIERMRKSMAKLTPQFSANRTLREYTEQRYLPAAENWQN